MNGSERLANLLRGLHPAARPIAAISKHFATNFARSTTLRALGSGSRNWYLFRSGVPGFDYGTSFAQGGRVRAEVYIDLGDAEANKMFFDRLFARRQAIEEAFQEPLSWERLDERRASRVAVYCAGSIDVAPEELARLRAWAVDRLLRFRKVFGPIVRELVEARSA